MSYQHILWNWYATVRTADGAITRSSGPYRTHYLVIDEHIATQFDAPAHFIPPPDSGLLPHNAIGTQTGEQVLLQDLQGSAAVIDVRRLEQKVGGVSPVVTADHVKQWEVLNGALAPGGIVLLSTGWDRYYVQGEEGMKCLERPVLHRNFPGWPAPSAPLIEYLLERGIRCLGIDAPSIGAAHDPIPAHMAGLS